MSSPVTVNFSSAEKHKIINFLKEKKESYDRKILSLEREHQILIEFQDTLKNAPDNYVKALSAKVKSWLSSINTAKLTISKFDNFITLLQGNEAFNPRKVPEVFNSLRELFLAEREKQSLPAQYKYYPRLRKAKEESLYVFSNKIKTIMEYENVKVA